MRIEEFVANNALDFVTQLRNTAWEPQSDEPQSDIFTYMQNYRRWSRIIDGADISVDSPDAFVSDLCRHGYLHIDGVQYSLDMYRQIIPFDPAPDKLIAQT